MDALERIRKCEAGMDCNHYYRCFDRYDNPTDDCAIDYCEMYVDGEFGEETNPLLSAYIVKQIIDQFSKDYNGFLDGNSFEYGEEVVFDDIKRVMYNTWHEKVRGNKSFDVFEQRCMELVLRILDSIG